MNDRFAGRKFGMGRSRIRLNVEFDVDWAARGGSGGRYRALCKNRGRQKKEDYYGPHFSL
jgi:hypothetical protein